MKGLEKELIRGVSCLVAESTGYEVNLFLQILEINPSSLLCKVLSTKKYAYLRHESVYFTKKFLALNNELLRLTPNFMENR